MVISTISISIIVVCAVLLVIFQRRFIYLPSGAVARPPASMGVEEIVFVTEDGLTLAGWFIAPSVKSHGTTVLVFNGNGGNRSDRLHLANTLSNMGHAVMLFDYRGYGTNQGNPSEGGLLSDGRAAVQYLERRADVDPQKIVYLGESLGAGVAAATAEHRPPTLLILRSPFASLADAASEAIPFLPVSAMLWDEYPVLDIVGRLSIPMMVVAGSEDSTIPAQQSIDVFDNAIGPKKFVMVEGADHNDQRLSAGFLLADDVGSFIDEVVGDR